MNDNNNKGRRIAIFDSATISAHVIDSKKIEQFLADAIQNDDKTLTYAIEVGSEELNLLPTIKQLLSKSLKQKGLGSGWQSIGEQELNSFIDMALKKARAKGLDHDPSGYGTLHYQNTTKMIGIVRESFHVLVGYNSRYYIVGIKRIMKSK